ncbi:MAG: asparagine synthase-related protein [Acidobacteriota bacterium]|nr:asparagine synthase-related protein [Acidobacteriota bacterium]
MVERPIDRVVDLTDPDANRILGMSAEEARRRVAGGGADAVREIEGSFALVGCEGQTVRMARSLDRPMRYFLAKQASGPVLFVSDRIDAIGAALAAEGLADQFHPSYTRMVPAHHIVEIRLVGCPDPDAVHSRFFTPPRDAFPSAVEEIGVRYLSTLSAEIEKWLRSIPSDAPVGVLFSGGVDSGAVFLTTWRLFRTLGLAPTRLKAFTLSVEGGEDLGQARDFLRRLGLELFHEPIEVAADSVDPFEAVRVVEDYKPLDVECAAMSLALCRGIRELYPEWRFLLDGDGGDENLKDYPIEENPELTIRSVLNNPLLYQEGWGVGTLKHSRTYSGGQSRSYARTWAPLRRYGFEGFSPFTRPTVVAAAEGIPFIEMTGYDVSRLYELKGEIVSEGVRQVIGVEMPVFPKRRFQHGAISAGQRRRLAFTEADYRAHFASLHA